MNNKRGISQAFQQVPPGLILRPATVFDVFDISRVLIRSITELCAADHRNDPDLVAEWTANKDPQTIRDWVQSDTEVWLAETDGQIAGVGSLQGQAEISRLFVGPDHVAHGVGSALLAKLERELAAQGCDQAYLTATTTARAFYLRQGWQEVGTSTDHYGLRQFHMRKSLHPKVEG